jgi:hypothetical protein
MSWTNSGRRERGRKTGQKRERWIKRRRLRRLRRRRRRRK